MWRKEIGLLRSQMVFRRTMDFVPWFCFGWALTYPSEICEEPQVITGAEVYAVLPVLDKRPMSSLMRVLWLSEVATLILNEMS